MQGHWPRALVALCLCAGLAAAQGLAEDDLQRQQGTWVAVSLRHDGQDAPREIVQTITRTVEGAHVVWKRNGKDFAGTALELDPRQDPKAIDVIADGGPARGKRVLGIYKLENDKLTLCMADPDQPRPREFKAEKGSGHTLMIFTRQETSKSGPVPGGSCSGRPSA